jgi:hypothetical protein
VDLECRDLAHRVNICGEVKNHASIEWLRTLERFRVCSEMMTGGVFWRQQERKVRLFVFARSWLFWIKRRGFYLRQGETYNRSRRVRMRDKEHWKPQLPR